MQLSEFFTLCVKNFLFVPREIYRQSLPALLPASLDDVLAAFFTHPLQESVRPFPFYPARLVCSLQGHALLSLEI